MPVQPWNEHNIILVNYTAPSGGYTKTALEISITINYISKCRIIAEPSGGYVRTALARWKEHYITFPGLHYRTGYSMPINTILEWYKSIWWICQSSPGNRITFYILVNLQEGHSIPLFDLHCIFYTNLWVVGVCVNSETPTQHGLWQSTNKQAAGSF